MNDAVVPGNSEGQDASSVVTNGEACHDLSETVPTESDYCKVRVRLPSSCSNQAEYRPHDATSQISGYFCQGKICLPSGYEAGHDLPPSPGRRRSHSTSSDVTIEDGGRDAGDETYGTQDTSPPAYGHLCKGQLVKCLSFDHPASNHGGRSRSNSGYSTVPVPAYGYGFNHFDPEPVTDDNTDRNPGDLWKPVGFPLSFTNLPTFQDRDVAFLSSRSIGPNYPDLCRGRFGPPHSFTSLPKFQAGDVAHLSSGSICQDRCTARAALPSSYSERTLCSGHSPFYRAELQNLGSQSPLHIGKPLAVQQSNTSFAGHRQPNKQVPKLMPAHVRPVHPQPLGCHQSLGQKVTTPQMASVYHSPPTQNLAKHTVTNHHLVCSQRHGRPAVRGVRT